MKSIVIALVAVVAAVPGTLQAQQPQEAERGSQDAAATLTLVYEREVYSYSPGDRRDPFRPLTDADAMGPRFEALRLRGIIYSTGRGRSIALIGDTQGRVYRARAGDLIGNSRVVEISPSRVVLAVENFGTIRQEILELPTRGGTDR